MPFEGVFTQAVGILRRDDLLAGGAIGAGLIVRLSSGEYVTAGAADSDALGVAREDAAEGEALLVQFWVPSQRVQAVSAGAFSARVPLFQAASGKLGDSGTILRAISLEAATGADELVDVLLI